MREQEWLTSANPTGMLTYLHEGCWDRGPMVDVKDRQYRLFAVACCRAAWPQITDEWSQRAVVIAERHVEKLDDADRMFRMHAQAFRVPGSESPGPLMAAAECCNRSAIRAATQVAQLAILNGAAKVAILRDIIGNPFSPYVVRWSGGPIASLARAAYDDRLPSGFLDPARLAVLADAVEEAGCTYEPLLTHLRDSGAVHARGCWSLDLCVDR